MLLKGDQKANFLLTRLALFSCLAEKTGLRYFIKKQGFGKFCETTDIISLRPTKECPKTCGGDGFWEILTLMGLG